MRKQPTRRDPPRQEWKRRSSFHFSPQPSPPPQLPARRAPESAAPRSRHSLCIHSRPRPKRENPLPVPEIADRHRPRGRPAPASSLRRGSIFPHATVVFLKFPAYGPFFIQPWTKTIPALKFIRYLHLPNLTATCGP